MKRTPTNSTRPREMFIPRCLDGLLPPKYGNVYLLSRSRGLVLGPHWPGVLVTVALIIGGAMLNLQVVASRFPLGLSKDLMITLVYVLFCATLGLLLRTATADPGIVFPTSVNKLPHVELATLEAGDSSGSSLPTGFSEAQHFCDICELYSLERNNVSHCFDCAVCVTGMDHHW